MWAFWIILSNLFSKLVENTGFSGELNALQCMFWAPVRPLETPAFIRILQVSALNPSDIQTIPLDEGAKLCAAASVLRARSSLRGD